MQRSPFQWARVAADTLTYGRLLGGVALAVWPWEAQSTRALAALLRCKILLWSADALDGALARRSQTPPSWIGRHDMWVDAFVTLGTGVALARMGFVPAGFVAAWLAVCVALYAVRRVQAVLLVFMFPLQLALVVSAVVHRLPDVGLFAGWLALVAFVERRRLKWVIAVFIDDLPEGLRRWILSWLPRWLRLTPEERASQNLPRS